MQIKPRYLAPLLFLFALSAHATETVELTQFRPFKAPTKWRNGCVQYTAAALLKSRGVQITSAVYDAIGKDINPAQSGATLETLASYLSPWFHTEATSNTTTDDLQKHLAKGLPVVVALETDELTESGWRSTHAVILLPENLSPQTPKPHHWTIEDNGYYRGTMADAEFLKRWIMPTNPSDGMRAVFVRPRHRTTVPITHAFERDKGWRDSKTTQTPSAVAKIHPVSVAVALSAFNRIDGELNAVRSEMKALPPQFVTSFINLKQHPRVPLKKREVELVLALRSAYRGLPKLFQTPGRKEHVYGKPPRYLQLQNPEYLLGDDDLEHHLNQLQAVALSANPDRVLAPYPDLETELRELKLRKDKWATTVGKHLAIKKRIAVLERNDLNYPTANQALAAFRMKLPDLDFTRPTGRQIVDFLAVGLAIVALFEIRSRLTVSER